MGHYGSETMDHSEMRNDQAPIPTRVPSDRAPAITEVSVHIYEEVGGLHVLLDQLMDLLAPILTPEVEQKDVGMASRSGMSDLSESLLRSRRGIQEASQRIRALADRIDL